MTNHITDLQEQLSTLEYKGDPAPSRLAILQIAATLAIASELRTISNMMTIGQPDDLPPRIPAEAGEMARGLDAALGEVATPRESSDWECAGGLISTNRTWQTCDVCPHNETCDYRIPF